jgi:hypothetical protein
MELAGAGGDAVLTIVMRDVGPADAAQVEDPSVDTAPPASSPIRWTGWVNHDPFAGI